MKTFSFLFDIKLGEMILSHSDNISRALQHQELSASECQVLAKMTVRTMETMRTDASYNLFWERLQIDRTNFEVDEAVLPRKKKCTKQYDDRTSAGDYPATPKLLYRQQYFEALDLIINSIKSRFEQEGYNINKNL